MRKAILPFSFILLIFASCRKQEAATDTAVVDTAGTTSTSATATVASPSYDLQFLDTMSKHHQLAVDMAKMAKDKITNKELKAMVTGIPTDQQKEIDQMKAWRDQWYAGAPPAENMQMPGMSASMNMDMGHMQSMKQGKDYDAMFIDMMVPHHEGAVQMSQDALGKAEHAETKTLAQNIIAKQQKEIDDMKRIKGALK